MLWDFAPGSSIYPTMYEIKTRTEHILWQHAANHINGAGLENGVDLTVRLCSVALEGTFSNGDCSATGSTRAVKTYSAR